MYVVNRLVVIGGEFMKKTVQSFREVTASDEFRMLVQARFDASNREASALDHAKREERAVWQCVVADKNAEIAELKALLNRKK